jgi:hypothetical protein
MENMYLVETKVCLPATRQQIKISDFILPRKTRERCKLPCRLLCCTQKPGRLLFCLIHAAKLWRPDLKKDDALSMLLSGHHFTGPRANVRKRLSI